MKLLYIAGENRSGSTLLDTLIGGHSKSISVGEISRFGQFYRSNDQCTCLQPVPECELWSKVTQKMEADGNDMASLETRVRNSSRLISVVPSVSEIVALVPSQRMHAICSRVVPAARRSQAAAEKVWELCEAVAEASRADWIVDSSKRADQCLNLYRCRPAAFRMIHIVRDGRAVAYSMSTRSAISYRRAVRSWLLNTHLHTFVQRLIPASQQLRVRYEDLCQSPKEVLKSICCFMNIDFEESMLKTSTSVRHNIGGSPRRFDPGELEIKLDRRWETEVSDQDLNFFSMWAGRMNRRLGYSDQFDRAPEAQK